MDDDQFVLYCVTTPVNYRDVTYTVTWFCTVCDAYSMSHKCYTIRIHCIVR